jgi:hypothetical protein
MRMTIVCWLVLALPLGLDAQIAPISSRDQEVTLALSAAPPVIAAHAVVYVLTPTGYEKARDGTNGFTCLVTRDHLRSHPDEMGPTCYDPEGTRTIVPRIMAEARMRLAGKSEQDIASAVQAGLKDGTYRVPQRAGLAYMLSAHARGLFPGADSVSPVEAHVMIYAPYLKNADIDGVVPGPGQHLHLPFVLDDGQYNAYIIVPWPRD